MLIGAVAGFSAAVATGNPWLGLVVAMLAGGVLSLVHAVMTIQLRADQVVSGLALTFLGTGPGARPRRRAVERRFGRPCSPASPSRLLADIPLFGPMLFRQQSVLTYVGYLLVPLAWYWINRTRAGSPPAGGRANDRPPPTPRASTSYRLRYVYVLRSAACWPDWPGRPSPWPSHRAGSATRRPTAVAGSRSGS